MEDKASTLISGDLERWLLKSAERAPGAKEEEQGLDLLTWFQPKSAKPYTSLQLIQEGIVKNFKTKRIVF